MPEKPWGAAGEGGVKAEARLGEILLVFTSLGMASFGGGLPGWMHREVVVRRGWMTDEAFLAGVALGQVLPGPNSINLALYIGQHCVACRERGWPSSAYWGRPSCSSSGWPWPIAGAPA
ncbi:chromate transporter [Siccirubricoccus deserti]